MEGRGRENEILTTSRRLGVPGEGLPAWEGNLLLKFELDMPGISPDLCSFVRWYSEIVEGYRTLVSGSQEIRYMEREEEGREF